MIQEAGISKSFLEELKSQEQFVQESIDSLYPQRPVNVPERLWEAMFYSLKAAGKRLRPILCIKTAEIFKVSRENSISLALGVEMIHTASLIHDDLPCMDNDSTRRGIPTNHIVFGEALSLLAGTSLFLFGLEYPQDVLSSSDIDRTCVSDAIRVLTKAAGAGGIHGGQVLDSDSRSRRADPGFVWEIAKLKTAALIEGAIEAGAALGGADPVKRAILKSYGKHLGLAFQIVDDILDIKGNSEELGKTTGKDIQQDKFTFIKNYGYERAKEFALSESEKAREEALKLPGEVNTFFLDLVKYLEARTF